MRATRTALLGLSTILFTLVATAPAAVAAVAPTALWATSVEDDLGRIRLGARSDSPITEIRAHLVSDATGQEVGVVSDFDLTSGTSADGGWESRDPVLLDALGGYRIDVELTDADGDHSVERVGGLSYLAVAVFDPLVASRTTVDYGHRTTRVTGLLRSRHPGTREVTPLGGAALRIDLPYPDFGTVYLVTEADGTFAADIDIKYAGDLQAVFMLDGNNQNVSYGESNTIPISIDQADVRVEAEVDRPRIAADETVTVSGRATWQSPDGWLPKANSRIGVLFEADAGGSDVVALLETDADGRYLVTTRPGRSGRYVITAVSRDPFVAQKVGAARVEVDH